MDHKTDTERGREALDHYLKDCDTHAIVPDVGGAFHAAFMAGRASLPLPGAQEAVAWAMFADNGNIRLWSKKPIPHPDAIPLYAAPLPALSAGWVMVPEALPLNGPLRDALIDWITRATKGECYLYSDMWAALMRAAALPVEPSMDGESNG